MSEQEEELKRQTGAPAHQCQAIVLAGTSTYHCTYERDHQGWHKFSIDDEGLAALAAAVEQERERCAQIALDFMPNYMEKEPLNYQLAAALRAAPGATP